MLYIIGQEIGWKGIEIFKLIEYLGANFASLFVYYHYESIYTDKPPDLRKLYPFSVIVATILLIITYMVKVISFANVFIILFFLNGIFVLYVTTLAMYVLGNVLKSVDLKRVKVEFTGQIFFLISAILLIGTSVLYFFQSITLTQVINLQPLLLLPLTLGSFIVIINYSLHPDYIYGIPYPVHMIIIFNKDSIPIYRRHTTTPLEASKHIKHKELSKAYVSVVNLVDNIVGNQTDLKSINHNNLKIIFKKIQDTNNVIVIITSFMSYYLHRSFERLTKMIPSDILKSWDEITNDKYIEKIDQILVDLLPFIELIETDLAARESIFQDIVNHDNIGQEAKANALMHLLEMLIIEYRTSQQKEILSDIRSYLQELEHIASINGMKQTLIDMKLLKANIEILDNRPKQAILNWNEAKKLLEQQEQENNNIIKEERIRILNEARALEGNEHDVLEILKKVDILEYIIRAKTISDND